MSNAVLPDIDLTRMSLEDLHRMRSWMEHHLGNAVTPLSLRLQMEMPGTKACDRTLQTAQETVDQIVGLLDEVRRVDDVARGRV
jgi:hypothetical protein